MAISGLGWITVEPVGLGQTIKEVGSNLVEEKDMEISLDVHVPKPVDKIFKN